MSLALSTCTSPRAGRARDDGVRVGAIDVDIAVSSFADLRAETSRGFGSTRGSRA